MKRFALKNQKLSYCLTTGSQRFYAVVLITVMFSLLNLSTTRAAAGALDLSFGNAGKVVKDFNADEDNDMINDLALQSDGKIVIAGSVPQYPNGYNFNVVRYLPDGTLDTTFGNGGRVFTDFYSSTALTVAIQQDGKIVAAGESLNSTNFTSDIVIARYLTNGTLDSSFGSGGKVRTDFGDYEIASSLLIAPDGKLLVGIDGLGSNGGGNFAVIRYNSNGSLDTTFGTGGRATAGSSTRTVAIGLQPDGRIVAAGHVNTGSTATLNLIRYNSNGTLDNSFNFAGLPSGTFVISPFFPRHMIIQPDGKIVYAAPIRQNTPIGSGLIRINSNGSLDSTFGNQGLAVSDSEDSGVGPSALALQANGKIVVAGSNVNRIGETRFGLARYLSNGTPDTAFGPGGTVITTFSGRDIATSVVIQADGKILAGGYSDSRATARDFAMARYLGDPTNFDMCIQDESNGNRLQVNTVTGEYQFINCSGVIFGGTGLVTRRGSSITLQHNTNERRISASIDTNTNRANASLQMLSQSRFFTIIDRNILNNTCACN